jgi:hypothetical protein
MSFTTVKTLKDLEKQAVSKGGKQGVKKFFSVSSGQSFKIRFRQELTEDSKNFNPDIGTAFTIPVITSIINWKWKIASTSQMAEHNYRCWATEQSAADKAWRPKPHLLINIAVETEPGVWEPRVLDTTFNQRHVGLTLIEYAKEFGTVVDRYYKYARTGSTASDTNYSLIPLETAPELDSIKQLPMHDLAKVYMTLPYDQQQVYLMTGELKSDSW